MHDNISTALITAFEQHYDTRWDDAQLRNERLAWRAAWDAAGAAPATVTEPAWDKTRDSLATLLLGLARRPFLDFDVACIALDAATEPGMPLAYMRGTPAAPALEAPAAKAAPLKATPEMRAAFRRAYREGGFWDDRLDYALDQMLAAAPQAPAAPVGDEREAFEAWIKKDGGDLSTFGSGQNRHYNNSAVDNAWTGWTSRAALAAPAVPEDPMDWPLPCDVTVGHGTIRKGCALRTLALRMQVLYDLSRKVELAAPAAPKTKCQTCSGHGAVGNILTAEPCPDCAPEPATPVLQLPAARAGRIYVAGPMTGLPDHNFPAFNAAAAALRAKGWHVENPAEHGILEGAEWADYLHYDMGRLATCSAVHLLPGWSKSRGASLEVHVATTLGMPIFYADGAEPVGAAPAAPAVDASDTALLDALAAESMDLRCFDMPTGQGDADVGWRVIQHHMGEPTERVVSEVYKDDPRSAIRAAIARLELDPYCTGPLHEEDAAKAAAKGEPA